MAIGKVEVIRSDIRRRDLRFIIAAVEGYAGKIFEGGISSLPLAIGQYGLGSRRAASKELASKAELFVESLQEFLSQHLPPNDWNVIIGGTIGFAIRGKHQATAVLRMRENNALASPRKSCVLLICRAPSVVGEIPKWLTDARDKRLIEIDSNTKNSEQMRRHSSFEGEDQKTDDGYSISKTQQNFDDRKIIEEILSEKQGESEEKENSLKRSLEKRNTLVKTHIRSFHATGNPRIDIAAKDSISVCPAVITEWGFLQLSLSTQQERLLRVFERAAIRCQPNQQDNIQLLAQSLRDELMVMSGPLWHVCVARDDIHVKTASIPVVRFTADWFISWDSSSTSGKLRVVGFQLCGKPSPPSTWEKFFQIAPYAATALLCLFWMLKSRLCGDERDSGTKSKSPFQEILAQRFCGHQGLEITTAFLFCLLIAVAIVKIVHRLI